MYTHLNSQEVKKIRELVKKEAEMKVKKVASPRLQGSCLKANKRSSTTMDFSKQGRDYQVQEEARQFMNGIKEAIKGKKGSFRKWKSCLKEKNKKRTQTDLLRAKMKN